MLSFFQKKDIFGNGLSVWVFAILLFVTPWLISILKTVEMDNEVEAWLPARDPQAVLLSWYSDNFPVQDQIFVSWDASSLNDPRAELLAAKLEGYVDDKGIERRGSPYVKEVLTPRESVLQMRKQKIDQDTAISSLAGLLVGHGPLKIRLTEQGQAHQEELQRLLPELIKSRLGIPASVLPAQQEWQAPTEFAEFTGIRQKVSLFDPEDADENGEEEPLEFAPIPPHDFQLAWEFMTPHSDSIVEIQALLGDFRLPQAPGEKLIDEVFFAIGSPICIVVTLNEAGEADRGVALDDIDRIAMECQIPMGSVHRGGRPVGSAMLNEEVQKAMFNPQGPWYARSVIVVSTLVSFLLAFLMVRSLRLGVLVQSVSIYATLLTVILVPLSGKTMNMVLVVMPTLLSVLTLSGAIHLVSYWKHCARENSKDAIINAIRMATVPCFLASATTAIGLASLTTSTLNPVRDFGIFSAVGCGISLVFVLFILPSLMQVWPGQPPAERESHGRPWVILADGLIKYSVPVVLVCMGMFAYGIYGLKDFKTDTKVVRNFQQDSRLIMDYWFLENNLVGVNTVDTIVRFDQDTQKNMQFLERLEVVRRVAEKIRGHADITGAISLADFQKQYPKPAENARFLEKIGYNKRSNEMEQRMRGGEVEAAKSLFTVAANDADWNVPGDLLLSRKGDELWRISAQAYVMADNDYGQLMDQLDQISSSVLDEYSGITHSVTGMVPVFLRTQEALLESLIRSFGMAFGIIAIVMIVLLRNPLAGLITMLPNLMPVAFCFGVMSQLGIHVDIGTMITASVALGIAVDGTLHLLTWFKNGLQLGKSRVESIELALSHCAPAMWQTSTIVAVGLLMLAPASLLMVSRFGILMAALIGAALLADILFLPALLNGPLGHILERDERKRRNKVANNTQTSIPSADIHSQNGQQTSPDLSGSNQTQTMNENKSGPHRTLSKSPRKGEVEAR
ncbi:MAG: MMPL family transporter [Planctomycetaceae bacterium]|nr:MMPL family transporter [Planctomycetaceae bacterium]